MTCTPLRWRFPGRRVSPGPRRFGGRAAPEAAVKPDVGRDSTAHQYEIDFSTNGESLATVLDKTRRNVTRYVGFAENPPTERRFVLFSLTGGSYNGDVPLSSLIPVPDMPYVMVDIEADGPIPGDYSMVCFGAIVVEPISDQFLPDALAVSGFTREECLEFDDPQDVMERFRAWLASNCKGRAMFISDNNGFDWQFINWYFHHFLGKNPFGFSSTNLGSLYKGMQKDTFVNFRHLRKTKHTHNPVDDARGNAEALLAMKEMGLKINLS